MTRLEALRSRAKSWGRALELYAEASLGGNSRGGYVIVAVADGTRRCRRCGKKHEVCSGEVIREDCPYCGVFATLEWITARGLRCEGPETEACKAAGRAHGSYTAQDWRIDFEMWVDSIVGKEGAIWVYMYAVDDYSWEDVAYLRKTTKAEVKKIIGILRDEWKGVRKCSTV